MAAATVDTATRTNERELEFSLIIWMMRLLTANRDSKLTKLRNAQLE